MVWSGFCEGHCQDWGGAQPVGRSYFLLWLYPGESRDRLLSWGRGLWASALLFVVFLLSLLLRCVSVTHRLPRPVPLTTSDAPSIPKYGSLVRPDAQMVALRAHCAKCAP